MRSAWTEADRPGEELLLRSLCAAGEVDGEGVERALASGVDWPRFDRLVKDNRVVPIAWRRLSARWGSALPGEFRRDFEPLARGLGMHLLVLARELLALVEACTREGIEALPYKGPVLAQLLYDDLAARQYRDIDLLIHARDVARARELLLSRGWRPLEQLDAAAEREWIERDCEMHFVRDSDLALELHWHVLPRAHALGWSAESLWQELVPAELAGVPIRTFGPEEWLVLLCIHGGDKHRWARLQMILDVARLLVVHPDLRWERVLALARALDRERTVQLGVFLAWDLLGGPLERDALDHVASRPDVLARAALLRDRPFEDEQRMPGFRTWSRAVRSQNAHLAAAGWPDPEAPRLSRYARAALEPDWGDRQALALPPGLDFLHWGLRPVRILGRHGVGILRRIGALSTE